MPNITFTPFELLGWLIEQPWFALIVGAVAALVIRAFRSARIARVPSEADLRVHARHAAENGVIGWSALAVAAIAIGDHLVRSYAMDLHDAISWWRFAAPVFGAGLGMAVLLTTILTTGERRSEQPVIGTAYRTWLTFLPRSSKAGGAVALLALVATTVVCGLLSSADQQGRHVYLAIPIPNEPTVDPIRIWFYGWAYGAPVLLSVAMLSAFTVTVLHANAVRPYIRPESVAREQTARRRVATGAVTLAIAAMLLALGDAWQFISAAGTTTRLTVQSDGAAVDYDVVWRGAEIASALSWFAPIIQIVAFTLLFLMMHRLRTASSATRSTSMSKLISA